MRLRKQVSNDRPHEKQQRIPAHDSQVDEVSAYPDKNRDDERPGNAWNASEEARLFQQPCVGLGDHLGTQVYLLEPMTRTPSERVALPRPVLFWQTRFSLRRLGASEDFSARLMSGRASETENDADGFHRMGSNRETTYQAC